MKGVENSMSEVFRQTRNCRNGPRIFWNFDVLDRPLDPSYKKKLFSPTSVEYVSFYVTGLSIVINIHFMRDVESYY